MAVHRLANALVEYEGLDVTVFSCDSMPSDARYRHARLFGGRIRRRLERWTLVPIGLNFVNFRGYDILHLHGDDWFFFNRRLPTVRTMNGSALQEARHAQGLKRKLSYYFIYPLECLASRLATITLGLGTETKEIYGLSEVIDYGVNLACFVPRPKYPEPLVMFVGTWSGRKRGQLLFEAFVEHVLPRYPTAKLYMACNTVPGHPNVINGGFPSDADLADWMAKAWIFAYPSSYEGFGIPYIEALASGTAIVTTRNSGAEYVLDGGRYGVLTSDSDFAPALVEMLGDSCRREHLEQTGLTYVSRFSWQQVAARHLSAYQSAIAQRSSQK